MAKTFTQSNSGVNINGFAVSLENWVQLEPTYVLNDQYPVRIYRNEGKFSKGVGSTELIEIGNHVVQTAEGKTLPQQFPSPQIESYFEKVEQYKAKILELDASREKAAAYEAQLKKTWKEKRVDLYYEAAHIHQLFDGLVKWIDKNRDQMPEELLQYADACLAAKKQYPKPE